MRTLLTAAVAMLPVYAQAQAVTPPALKAAFLYNFARFAEWPEGSLLPGERLTLCVTGDDLVTAALRETVRGRVIGGREVVVAAVMTGAPFESCHLLYVSRADERGLVRLLAAVGTHPVLTVSDHPRFAELGGIAQFIVDEDRMRFAINVASAGRARLQLSSRLLSLATIIN